jgi:nucleoside-diphosphate-sugar epimerase
MHDRKILISGPAGQIAFPLAAALAEHNEVWGVARFSDPVSRARVEAAGIRPHVADLATGELGSLPTDFDHVLHLAHAWHSTPDYDDALRMDAEGTHLLLQHCRAARSVLVMSTADVYRPHDDPGHRYVETDALGDRHSLIDPTYSIAKIAQEAVARSCARAYRLPTIICRMNAAYGANGGLPAYHLDWIRQGRPVTLRWDPAMYSPIHEDDIIGQVESLLEAATVPATIVNWGGDEAVSAQEWCALFGELTGLSPEIRVEPVPMTARGNVQDPTRRRAITGPCTVGWREGMRRLVEERVR